MSIEFTWPIKVYYEDTDAGGVVYYANYLKFFERARSEWLNALGINQAQLLAQDIGFVVKKADVSYVKPARLNDDVEVVSVITQVRGASLTFKQVAYLKIIDAKAADLKSRQKQILCEAEINVVCLKLATFKPCRMPAIVSKELQRVS